MRKNEYINTIIGYIEQHLEDEINLADLAKRNFISLRQLYREFYNYTGHSIIDYIRKRRISRACFSLKNTNNTITDIALSNGFDSPSAFNKIFKKNVMITPCEYRNSDSYYFFPYINNENQIKFVNIGSFPEEYGVSFKYTSDTNEKIEEKALSLITPYMKNHVFKIYGKTQFYNLNEYNYTLLIITKEPGFWLEKAPELGFSCVNKEKKNSDVYAYTTASNDCTDIINTWNYLYNIWLPPSMFECTENLCYEEYIFNKKGKHMKTRLYIPLKQKDDYNKISVIYETPKYFAVCGQTGENAEDIASEIMAKWILKNKLPVDNFFTLISKDYYECGIQVSVEVAFTEDNIRVKTIPAGTYAKISDTSYGDVSVFEKRLRVWLVESGYVENGDCFSIYRLVNDQILMDTFIPIKKTGKNGQEIYFAVC